MAVISFMDGFFFGIYIVSKDQPIPIDCSTSFDGSTTDVI